MKKLILFSLCCLMLGALNAQHTVMLKSGKKVEGIVMGIEDDVLSLAVNREIKKIELVQVASIFFNEHVPYDGEFVTSEPVKSVQSGKYTIQYQMKDRKIVTPPRISNATENKGIIVVDVMINRQGTVMKAKTGGVGSTTTNEYLLTKAKFAAQGAKFNVSEKGPVEQNGTIIINY